MLFAALGGLFAALGVVGIIVPLLPSTPFFLVAVACFARSSPRAYEWMLLNRYFGNQLRLYHEHRGASVRSKAIAIASIWVGITLSVVLAGPPLIVSIALYSLATLISAYLIRLRTIRADDLVHANHR